MSQGSSDSREMQPEYDIRGGERGKYFDRYVHAATITLKFEESVLITTITTSAPPVGSVTKPALYPPAYPSPDVQGLKASRT